MRYFRVFLIACFALLCTIPVHAQGKQFAVIVALDYNWSGAENRLRFTVSDADRFRRYLNLPDLQVRVLTDAPTSSASDRATRNNILSAVRTTLAKASPQDSFWFYFSGHGKFLKADDTSYLIPADVTRLDASTAISVRELRALLADRTLNKARASILVLDACESGSSRKWTETGPAETPLRTVDGIVTLAAARPDRVAYETDSDPVRGGLFTYYLCAGLAGAATPKPDVTLAELQRYVKSEVNTACERIGKLPQEPVFFASGNDWQNVVVGKQRPDILEALQIGKAGELVAGTVTERPPLEPGMIVVLADDSVGVDRSALDHLKEGLLKIGVPLISEETVLPFLALLRDAKQSAAALAEAERYNARLLLRVRVVSHIRESPSTQGVFTGNVTMTAELMDVYGRISASVTDTALARPSGQEDKALDSALVKVTAIITQKLNGKLSLKLP